MFRRGARILVGGAETDVPWGTVAAGQTIGYDGTQLYGIASSLPPLTSDVTVYCNSSTGNDSNSGAIGAPFQTLGRAWAERQKYGILLAKFRINLLGVGSYTMVEMAASICGTNGYFIIAGDPTAETILYTGNFTGNLNGTTLVVNTSAGLGVDTKKGQFIRVTSGGMIGAICQILTHTDSSITVVTRYPWLLGGTANGDTFQIFTPGTQIFTRTISGQPLASAVDWIGGSASEVNFFNPPRHIFFDVQFTGTGIHFIHSAASMIACFLTSTGTHKIQYSSVLAGGWQDGAALGIGADTLTYLLQGAGIFASGVSLSIEDGGTLCGYMYSDTPVSVATQSAFALLNLFGGRLENTLSVSNFSVLIMDQTFGCWLISRQISIIRGAIARLSSNNPIKFAITVAGSCIRCSYGGQAYLEGTNITGGTTVASGLGCDASDGGIITWKNQTPTLTGGTAGVDLKVNTGTAANATLAANGSSLADAVTQSIVRRLA
jgi:hypothetical protein